MRGQKLSETVACTGIKGDTVVRDGFYKSAWTTVSTVARGRDSRTRARVHEIRLHPVHHVDLMDRHEVTLQTGLLRETVAAVVTRKLAFSAALPLHVPPQVAQHRVAAVALLAGEPKPRQTCRTKTETTSSE